MATLTIPDETYRRLADRAAATGLTVEELAQTTLAHAESPPAPSVPPPIPFDEWQARFAAWQDVVRRRAGRYPAGFEADVSRESIYDGCGE